MIICHTKKQMKQKIRGITLISLIITVVVIFILAGTSIGILTSDNGILKNGNKTKEQAEIREEKDILKLCAVSALGANTVEGILKEDLEYYLDQNIGDEDYILEEQDGNFLVTFLEKEDGNINRGRQYKILGDATILEENEENLIIKLQPNSIPGLQIGEHADISIITNMNGNITWTSSNTNVCSIMEDETNDSKIQIIGKEPGTSQIVATVEQDGITRTAYCNIEVIETQAIRVVSVEIEKSKDVIDLSEEDKTMQLTAILNPTFANSGTDLTWISSNTNVLDVDENGLVTGKSNGTATVTVTTSNNKTATCDITVQTSPTGLTLDKTEITINLSGNREQKLIANIQPQEANVNTGITWTSSDSNIAKVDQTGLVTGNANGTATITATTENGKKAQCTVVIKTGITSVILNEENLILKPGETTKLTAMIEPNNFNLQESLKWTSSDTSIASIKTSGNNQTSCEITAKTPGEVTITVQNQDGTIKDSCTILVLPKVFGTNSKYSLKAYFNSGYELVYEEVPREECKVVPYRDCKFPWFDENAWGDDHYYGGNNPFLDSICPIKYKKECETVYETEAVYKYTGDRGWKDGNATINFQLSSYVPVEKLKLEKNGISQVNVGNIQVVDQSSGKYKISLTTSSERFSDGSISLKYVEGSTSIELYKWTISCK